jgi:phospholipid/cholesterol/gamma-HCH transport system substrate-binding protein
VQDTLGLFRDITKGREGQARRALELLPPSLAANARLFGEIDRRRGDFDRFIVETARLTTDLAAKDDDLAGVVSNLSTTLGVLAQERDALGSAVQRLPGFMRRANTTFVNLRASLDDLDPVVSAARPVVRRDLPALLAQLRPFAQDAAPTVADLSRTIRRDGSANDLVELLRLQPELDRIATRTAERNGKARPGAFPVAQQALKGSTPQFAFTRPYLPEVVGWFDDFSTSGAYDALGSFSRAGLQLNQFTLTPALDALLPVPLNLRDDVLLGTNAVGRNNRCPGSLERGALFKPSPDFNCDERQVPVGP